MSEEEKIIIPGMSRKDALEAISAYQTRLTDKKFEQETHRDNNLILIVGGALTVSFAFVSSLVEHHSITHLRWLEAAWILWVLALIATIVGYSVSIWLHEHVIQAISTGQFDEVRPRLANRWWIELTNRLIDVFAIGGFIFFTAFLIGNLERISHGEGKEESKKESITGMGASSSEFGANASSGYVPSTAPR